MHVIVPLQSRREDHQGPSLPLSSTRVYVLALGDRRIRDYLPDYEHEKPINRQYLFNVSYNNAVISWHLITVKSG